MVPALPDRWPVPYVAVLVGLVLLANPIYLAGPHLGDDVYRYEAHAVAYEADDGLVTTNLATGEPSDLGNVDDAVICEGHGFSRECAFEYAVFSGDVNVAVAGVGPASYRFVYLDGAFYRPTDGGGLGGSGNATHERVSAHEALRAVSTPLDDASAAMQSVVEEGEHVAFRELDAAGELLRTSGGYRVVVRDAAMRFDDSGWVCRSGDDGFCDRAGRARLVASLPHLAGVAVGALLCWSGLAALRSGRRLRDLAREADR